MFVRIHPKTFPCVLHCCSRLLLDREMPINPCGVLSHVLEDSALSDWGGWVLWANRAAPASVRLERGSGNRSSNFDLSSEQRIFSSPDLFSANL